MTQMRMTAAEQREAQLLRQSVHHLLAAIDELNTAKPLVEQPAWRRVLMWADTCRPEFSRDPRA